MQGLVALYVEKFVIGDFEVFRSGAHAYVAHRMTSALELVDRSEAQ